MCRVFRKGCPSTAQAGVCRSLGAYVLCFRTASALRTELVSNECVFYKPILLGESSVCVCMPLRDCLSHDATFGGFQQLPKSERYFCCPRHRRTKPVSAEKQHLSICVNRTCKKQGSQQVRRQIEASIQ